MCGMPTVAAPSRRARQRTQTLADIRRHGYAQIAQGGPTALSLNGIAKAMGMSGPALYRYFDSRDALLATLVAESYEALADALIDAAEQARRHAPEDRVRAAAAAFRGWALEHPHRYRLVFGSTYGSGALDPERVIPAAHRSMSVLLAALADLGPAAGAPRVGDAVLERELADWGERHGEAGLAPGVLLLGLAAWTRMHGIVSLEIEGVFEQLGVDPARLYGVEVDHLIAQRAA
jgi:AcrR family transcriptional regulator